MVSTSRGSKGQGGESLRRLHADITGFCRDVTDEEWLSPSRAEGWRVHDVMAHMSGTAKALFTPTAIRLLASNDIERANDTLVDSRRTWARSRVEGEFDRWGPRVASMVGGLGRTPIGGIRVPLAELGRFPLVCILGEAVSFDQHTHLHHDLAPALDREAPPTDDLRMTLVVSWMMRVLGNQLTSANPAWLDRPIAITLDGPGGGTWRIEPGGAIAPGSATGAAVTLASRSVDFPAWGTARVPAKVTDLTITGDVELSDAFLGSLNIV